MSDWRPDSHLGPPANERGTWAPHMQKTNTPQRTLDTSDCTGETLRSSCVTSPIRNEEFQGWASFFDLHRASDITRWRRLGLISSAQTRKRVGESCLSAAPPREAAGALPVLIKARGAVVENRHSNRHTPGFPGSARCVQRFDDSLFLRFALLIAFRCVLHRCGSQDIRC